MSGYNSNEPYYFGRYFKAIGGYNSGGAAYVFSKRTLKDFNNVMQDPNKCKLQNANEDVAVGECLRNTPQKTVPGDTRDEYGRETFHPFTPLGQFTLSNDSWLVSYDNWKSKAGKECCSDRSISFHYVSPAEMYVMEYMIYKLQQMK